MRSSRRQLAGYSYNIAPASGAPPRTRLPTSLYEKLTGAKGRVRQPHRAMCRNRANVTSCGADADGQNPRHGDAVPASR